MTSDLLSLHARFVVDVITNAENTKRSDNIKDNISPYNLPIQASTFLPRNAYRICIAQTAVASCPSVCHTPVLSVNSYTYPQKFFTIR